MHGEERMLGVGNTQKGAFEEFSMISVILTRGDTVWWVIAGPAGLTELVFFTV